MSKHREAFEAFQTIFNYTQRKCKNCIFSIKGIKDEDFCVFEGCPGVFVSDYLNEDIRKRVEELEVQERVNAYKDLEETRNICRKYADEIRGLGET